MSWEDNVRRTVPYTPGEQPKISNIIKLNTNENPYPPSPSVAKVLSRMDAGELRKYPDPAAQRLTDALSAHFGVPADQIFVGVGSDDVLAMSFREKDIFPGHYLFFLRCLGGCVPHSL